MLEGVETISRVFKEPVEKSRVEGDGNPEYPKTEVGGCICSSSALLLSSFSPFSLPSLFAVSNFCPSVLRPLRPRSRRFVFHAFVSFVPLRRRFVWEAEAASGRRRDGFEASDRWDKL